MPVLSELTQFLALEVIRFTAMAGILVIMLWWYHKVQSFQRYMFLFIAGFFLIVVGNVVDLLDDYSFLESISLQLAGPSVLWAEKMFGYLAGMILIFAALARLLPQMKDLEKTGVALGEVEPSFNRVVAEREADLRDARDRAQEASDAKSQFLANLSDEVRAPMNGILGMANLLDQSELTREQRDSVQTIRESGQALLSVFNDVLDLSKVEADRLALDEADFNMDKLLANIEALWSPAAGAKGIDFSVHNELTKNTWIRSDQGRIRQALNNLLGNAVKFTSEGQIRLTVREFPANDGVVGLRFEVSDTGIGVAPEDTDRIFQPFVRADNAVTGDFAGNGLGLAISKRFAELMGGETGVSGRPGEGATFWFTIAAQRSVAANQNQGASPSGQPSPAQPEENRELRILIAEDDAANQKVITGLISGIECRFDIVENGLEAVAAVARTEYDVVLMGVHLPEMDGITATKRIRTLGGDAGKIPIIAMTGNSTQGDREKYLAAAMTDVVAKPIDRDELTEAISRCASGSTTDPSNRRSAQSASPELDAKSSEELETLIGNLDGMVDTTGN